jgi:hypothetical protein
MNKIIVTLFVIVISISCTTTKNNELSKLEAFEYYFPTYMGIKEFESIDEAIKYIKEGNKVMVNTIDKYYAKGLTAKLEGTLDPNDKKVYFQYYMFAYDGKNWLDLSKLSGTLKNALRNSVAVTFVYVIGDDSRAVSVSNYYLVTGYRYNFNDQIEKFYYKGNELYAVYPKGWGLEKAFKYMRKEID